tara:strand:- start:7385 stop:8545 length:1161 start_codon:yes stop_codon:yes gene_type:complete
MNPLADLKNDLELRKLENLYRTRQILYSPQGVEVNCNGKKLLSFCSNDYLGLANDPRLIEANFLGMKKYGVGSGAAHLISGHSHSHHLLEQELSDFLGVERVLLFSTGYMANVGILTSLMSRNDIIFQDKLNHASLIDGGLQSRARLRRYDHLDTIMLESMLEKIENKSLIASDGVFSMDGVRAPIENLIQLSNQFNSALLIDDAHGFGVLGENGKGSIHALGLSMSKVPLYVATLGKALGTMGAFVAGSEELIETLIQRARSYIYTTAMPPSLAEATRASLKIMASENWRRLHLTDLVNRFRAGAKEFDLELVNSDTPIQPIILGNAETALRWSNTLFEKGILINAIRPPTVPEGSARLRITFSATHQIEHIDYLLGELRRLSEN